MRAARCGWIPRAILVLALSGPHAVTAEPAADLTAARAAFVEGSNLARQRRWGEACDRYALSLRLHRAALTIYSLGVAQRETGKLVAARATFEAFLQEPISPKTQAYMEPAREAIRELSVRAASLAVVLAPAGSIPDATVTVDGALLPEGTFAQNRAVDPGVHEVVARATGRIEARSRVTLPEGGSITLTLTLLPSSGPLAGPPPRLDASTPGPEKPANKGAPWPSAVPFALLGIGGAAIAGGVALGLTGLKDASDAPSSTGRAANEARAMGLAGDVLAASGIAVAGVGLVLLLVQHSRPLPGVLPTGSTLSPTFRLTPTATGLSISF